MEEGLKTAKPPLEDRSEKLSGGRLVMLLGLLLAVIGAIVIFWATTDHKPSVVKSSQMPTNAAIEEKWGIRVTQVGLSGDGGLVDFRYMVIDPDKALTMLQSENNLPVLVSEENQGVVNSAALMPAKHALNPGQTYFLLYRNTGGALKHDSSVSVVFGNIKLEHVLIK